MVTRDAGSMARVKPGRAVANILAIAKAALLLRSLMIGLLSWRQGGWDVDQIGPQPKPPL
jgi:hypothetical protein